MRPPALSGFGGPSFESPKARALLALFLCLPLGMCFIPGLNLAELLRVLGPGLTRLHRRSPAGGASLSASPASGNPSRLLGSSGLHAATLPSCVALVVLLANALRVQNCDPLEGVAFFLAGAGFSMLYAGQIGALMSLVFRGGKAYIATLLLIFIWLAWDAYSLYVEPVIYAYSPFIGFFSGAIYDDVIVLDLTYGVYRLYNLLQLSLL